MAHICSASDLWNAMQIRSDRGMNKAAWVARMPSVPRAPYKCQHATPSMALTFHCQHPVLAIAPQALTATLPARPLVTCKKWKKEKLMRRLALWGSHLDQRAQSWYFDMRCLFLCYTWNPKEKIDNTVILALLIILHRIGRLHKAAITFTHW